MCQGNLNIIKKDTFESENQMQSLEFGYASEINEC